jgi:hypothetical protein
LTKTEGRPSPLPEKITLILHRKVLEITAFQLFETAKFRVNFGGTPREIPGDFPTKKGVDFGGVKTRSRKEQLRVFGKLFQSIIICQNRAILAEISPGRLGKKSHILQHNV